MLVLLDYIFRTKTITVDPDMCVAARTAPYRAVPGTRLFDGLASMPMLHNAESMGTRAAAQGR